MVLEDLSLATISIIIIIIFFYANLRSRTKPARVKASIYLIPSRYKFLWHPAGQSDGIEGDKKQVSVLAKRN